MLQQILQDLFVDPEILAELNEDEKQILFVKMREEQVRRWKEREAEFEEELTKNPRPKQKGGKKVDFMKGRDGCEWVWVMGEHKNDLTIEEILEREAQSKAQQQAEQEALALKAEKEEAELKAKIEEEKRCLKEETERLEAEMKQKEELSRSNARAREELDKITQLRQEYEQREQQRLQELSEEQKRLRRRSMEVMEKETKRRSSEIYVQWKAHRQELQKQVEEGRKEVEDSWKINEVKSKEAEAEMRDMARKARMEYRESIKRASLVMQAVNSITKPPTSNKPPVPPKRFSTVGGNKGGKPRPLRPRNRAMVVDWFIKEEKGKGSGLDPDTGLIAQWFHGLINRAEAESLLADKGSGAFLVRVSERVWGYTISHREKERCKHFLIDTTDEGYQFIGANQMVHKSLADLVAYYKETPITISGQERLTTPVGQASDPPDYSDLFQGSMIESTTL